MAHPLSSGATTRSAAPSASAEQSASHFIMSFTLETPAAAAKRISRGAMVRPGYSTAMSSFGGGPTGRPPLLRGYRRGLPAQLVHRAVCAARTEDRAAAHRSSTRPPRARRSRAARRHRHLYPPVEQVNQHESACGISWLAGLSGREHGVIGITGVPQMRYNDITIGDFIQATGNGSSRRRQEFATARQPCEPAHFTDRAGRTLPCVSLLPSTWQSGVPNGSRSYSRPSVEGCHELAQIDISRSSPPSARRGPRATVLREIRTAARTGARCSRPDGQFFSQVPLRSPVLAARRCLSPAQSTER